MRKEQFKSILNEWKEFILESAPIKFKKNDIDKKVKVTICCSDCEKYTKMKSGETFTGKLKAIDVFDFKKSDDSSENVVIVDKKGEEKRIPQCCVSLDTE